MNRQARHFYEFGPFRLDVSERLLFRDGESVPLTPKVFDTLLVLVENSGHILPIHELMEMVWPDAIVEENNLRQTISTLRKILGDTADEPRYIETIPRRGYRFVAHVQEQQEDLDDLILIERTRSHVVIKEETGNGEEPKQDQTPEPPSRRGPAVSSTSMPSRFLAWLHLLPRPLPVVAALLLVGLASAAYIWNARQAERKDFSRPIRSIAVLPFQVLSAEDDDEYLGVGMADTLITTLSNLRPVVWRPTSAVIKYATPQQDLAAVGRELRVDAVLEGSIHRVDERIRVTLRLLTVPDGVPLWTGKFDEKLTDILAVQDVIAEKVASVLVPTLSHEETNLLTRRHTGNPQAYHFYLKGRYSWNKRNADAMRKSVAYFKKAIEEDPTFALAYVGLADALAMIGSADEATQAVERAIALDNTLGEAHATRGFIRMFRRWDWAGAEHAFRRAIELNAGYATAHHWYALYLGVHGRLEEATVEMSRALEMDPLSPNLRADLGLLFYFQRRYDQAIEQCREALDINPNFHFAHQHLLYAYLKKGMYDRAAEEFSRMHASYGIREDGQVHFNETPIRRFFQTAGIRGVLRTQMDDSTAEPDAYHAAQYAAFLAEREQALEWLQKAYEDRNFYLVFVGVDPLFDDLRSDPRFQELLRHLGLSRK